MLLRHSDNTINGLVSVRRTMPLLLGLTHSCSLRLSVYPSVTFLDHVETVEDTDTVLFSPYGNGTAIGDHSDFSEAKLKTHTERSVEMGYAPVVSRSFDGQARTPS